MIDEKKVDELLELLRTLNEKFQKDLPVILTTKQACREMSIKPSTLKAMISSGDLATCRVKGRQMVPVSEVYRIAQPGKPARRGGGRPANHSRHDARNEAAKLRELQRSRKR
jgi:hypothetical protein